MLAPLARYSLVLALVAVGVSLVLAQPKPPAPKPAAAAKPADEGDDYRTFFKKPTTVPDYWDAMQFEMEVGRYDLAVRHLRGLMALKPTDKQLVGLERKFGMAAFLRLRTIRKWSDDPKVQKQAVADVDQLIEQTTKAVKAELGDRKRIELFIKNLTASPEEASYALKELYRSGALVVPYMIEEWRTGKPDERLAIMAALRRLGPDTFPPLLAALDSDDADLQVDLIDLFVKRAATQVVPYLWYLSASETRPERVRRKATDALAQFLDTKPARLPSAKVELTQQAERYYQHQVKFANPAAVVVWRWDGTQHPPIVEGWPGAPTVTIRFAEEYYGTRFARRALLLDPSYRPAQLVLASLALERGMERSMKADRVPRPLAKTDPAYALLTTVNSDLVMAVLERALRDRRVPVILGAVRDLGARKEVRAVRPSRSGEPPLVRALYFPDRRVQRAAVEALLHVPGKPVPPVGVRIVDVLRRELAGLPDEGARHKVLVGFGSEVNVNRVADAVARAGYEPVKATTGKAVMRRLKEASDIDLLLIDADLPFPEMPYLLAQLHADRYASRLPVLLTARPAREEKVSRFALRYPHVTVVPTAVAVNVPALQRAIQVRLADPGAPALSAAERTEYAEGAVRELARLAKGEPPGYDIRPAAPAILEALRANKLSKEGQLAALEAAGRLPDNEAQREIYRVVVDARRPVDVRVAATAQLIRHVQRHSLTLTRDEVKELVALYLKRTTDPALKANLALVMGTLRPDARRSGERLLDYEPPVPAKLPPPKPAK